MRLICVHTILDLEKSVVEGKKVDRTNKILEEFCGPNRDGKEYAILSHCWGAPEQEVSFQDMEQLVTIDEGKMDEIRARTGYKKIIDTCKQAQKDRLEWVWVDTCCIDKKSSSELSEAINSMYSWYKNAKLCYTHFHDIAGGDWTYRDRRYTLRPKTKWFSRGWTLQELIAPKVVHFFNQEWQLIGDKKKLAPVLSSITRIPERILKEGLDSGRPSVAQVLSWAADRETTREEDRAYSLLGLLGVHMSMLYGEGRNAFRRLQLQIMRTSNDQSIFAWAHSRMTGWSGSFLADDPNCFRDCANIVSLPHDEFIKALEEETDISKEILSKIPANRFRTFTITNDGIQIWLPTTTVGPISTVTLACRDKGPALITVGIALLQSGSFRFFGGFSNPGTAEFRQHFLPYTDAKCPSSFTFKLDCPTLSHEGFTQRHLKPTGLEVKDGSVTLSAEVNDFAVVTYVHDKDYRCFSVLLSYWRGRFAAFVAFCPGQHLGKEQLAFLRLHALDRLIKEDPKYNGYFVQNAHLPGSIRCIRIVHRLSETSQGRCTVTIDITRCSGCCSPKSSHYSNLVEAPQVLGVMSNYLLKKSSSVYRDLLVDSSAVPLLLTQSEIKLGDYGRLSDNGEIFERYGNILELADECISGPLNPIKNAISHAHRKVSTEDFLIAHTLEHEATDFHYTNLALRDAIGLSLPATWELVYLLKELSFHLAGTHLVTTVIQCSECYYDRRDSSHSLSFEPPDPKTWEKLDTSTPLHTALMPIYWCPVHSCLKLVQDLQRIRHNFFVLVGWAHKLGEPNNSSQAATIEDADKFFVDIFGGSNFKDYIGEITFFRELPSMVATEIGDKPWTEMDKGNSPIMQHASEGTEVMAITQEQRIEVLVRYLMQISCPRSHSGQRLGTGIPNVARKLWEIKSKHFSMEFLQTIAAAYREWKPGSPGQDDVFGRREFLSNIEEIKKLQEILDETNDEDERRTLAEDIAGKILLICWRGISCEIKRVLGEVADRFVSDGVEQQEQKTRANCVYNIGGVFEAVSDRILHDGLDPLRRMMHDTEAGVSKYQLLLAERAKWDAERDALKRTSYHLRTRPANRTKL